jgi:Cdc6-like AAA superfamily ATPase
MVDGGTEWSAAMNVSVHSAASITPAELTDELRLARLAPRPQELAATGLNERLLADLTAKHLYSAGTLTLAQLAERLGLIGPIVEKVLNFMRREAKVEIKPRLQESASLPYALTDRGRTAALDALSRSGYVGTAPVPLADYVKVVAAQTVHGRKVGRDDIRSAFEGMFMPESAADQFGISVNSGRPVFIYGPAGTGKTYVTHRLSRLFRELVLIPRAIAIDETIVQVFDPLLHKAVEISERQSVMLQHGHDARYIACERPVIVTGGELTMDLLDVRYDPTTRQYEAPLQLKANNGMFVIDDLGRQKMAPDALLNRWIVPMNEKRDYHALGSGRHFVSPFDVVLVFSSNLHPLELTDEAFLRRIGHKIYCGYVSREGYEQIWEHTSDERDVAFDPELLRFVLEELHARRNVPLLPCHPKDLIEIALDKAAYIGQPKHLTDELLTWAWDTYFVSLNEASARPMRWAQGENNG